ncbi:unnamed protein product [Arabidopsis thaliana]|uniref:Uncharacterized protein n=1 Tax=Arabidopsis thaliana TaxID=3702 RepID=A0A654GF13_ARATH|nr:unnamed protein product [Arabidopsis thaliana]
MVATSTENKQGKNPIKSWDKLKEKLCKTFSPPHYTSLVSNHGHVQDKDFVAKSVHGINEDELSIYIKHFLEVAVNDIYGDKLSTIEPLFDVKEVSDSVVDVEGDDGLINPNDTDDDADVADPDEHDQIQEEDSDFDAKKLDINLSTSESLSNGDLIYDVKISFPMSLLWCDEDVKDAYFIGNQEVESHINHELVINNLDEKEEVSFMYKEKYNYSISLANRQWNVNDEPPDRGRSEILVFDGKVDLCNKLYGTLVSYISNEKTHCYDDSYEEDKEIIEVKLLEKSKILVPFRHWRLIREDFHVSRSACELREKSKRG